MRFVNELTREKKLLSFSHHSDSLVVDPETNRSRQMNQISREQKVARFHELTKLDKVCTGREFAATFAKARPMIDRPHGHRDWNILKFAR